MKSLLFFFLLFFTIACGEDNKDETSTHQMTETRFVDNGDAVEISIRKSSSFAKASHPSQAKEACLAEATNFEQKHEKKLVRESLILLYDTTEKFCTSFGAQDECLGASYYENYRCEFKLAR